MLHMDFDDIHRYLQLETLSLQSLHGGSNEITLTVSLSTLVFFRLEQQEMMQNSGWTNSDLDCL